MEISASKAVAMVMALGFGACLPSFAYGASPASAKNTAASTAGEDCFALGDVGARESCIARKPDDEIAECEHVRAHACKPYKEMHALERKRVQLSQEILTKARKRYASYVEGDAAYLDDLASYLKGSDAAWAAYRDADCLLEPFSQGMSRREAPDLTEACRVDRTKARIAELEALAVVARYPVIPHGVWQADFPTCKLPGNLDSDVRIEVTSDELVDYEQWNEPVPVTRISHSPQAWKINSRLHIDEGTFDHEEIYALSGQDDSQLTIVDGNRVLTYARCR